MDNRYINYNRRSRTSFDLIILICWILFAVFSTYEGYLPGGLGGATRYLLILWLVVMVLRLGSNIFLVKTDQFLWLIWWGYYFISIAWTDNMAQASVYVFTVTLMTFLCIFVQYFTYGPEFCNCVMRLFKLASVSVALLSIFSFIDIGSGTRRVLYLFGTYVDPNGQVASIAIGSGLCLYGVFSANNLRNKILDFILFTICCFSVFQTGSRSGIVILTIQIMIIVLFWHPEKNSIFKESAKWIVLFVLGVIAIYFMTNFISSDIIDRLLGRGSLEFLDGTQREERWAEGVEYFLQNPIMGNGWGTFECHNTFLTMLVDIGLIGNLVFYVLIIRLYFNAFRTRDISAIMILTSGLVPAFFIGAQNKRFFWGAIMLASLLINCRGDNNDYQDIDGKIKSSI